MKTIIYVGAFRFPAGDAAAARVLNNAKALKLLGYDVIFLSWGGEPRELDKTNDGYFYQGFRYINTHEIDINANFLIKLYKYYLGSGKESMHYFRQNSNNINAIICYNPSNIFSKQLLRFCTKEKINLISDLTEWYNSNEFSGDSIFFPAWLNYLNMVVVQKRIKNKIVISSFLDKYYRTNNIIVPPLVDKDEEKWNMKETHISKKKNKVKKLRLLYVGTPARKDLLLNMLRAVLICLYENKEIEINIVGSTIDYIKDKTLRKSIEINSNAFIFHGRLPQEKIPDYFHYADFSVLLRKNTRKSNAGFPTKIAETMMSNCPVIANYTSDLSKYIIDGYNGIVVENDSVEAMKKCIMLASLLSNKQKTVMKQNALKTGIEKFDYRNYVDAFGEFFSNLKI